MFIYFKNQFFNDKPALTETFAFFLFFTSANMHFKQRTKTILRVLSKSNKRVNSQKKNCWDKENEYPKNSYKSLKLKIQLNKIPQ